MEEAHLNVRTEIGEAIIPVETRNPHSSDLPRLSKMPAFFSMGGRGVRSGTRLEASGQQPRSGFSQSLEIDRTIRGIRA